MNNITINSNSNDIKEMEKLFPRAPLKIYYMTQVAVKPPSFVIFVNDKELMHFSYQRYLENKIRESFGFKGTSLKFFVRERKERDN